MISLRLATEADRAKVLEWCKEFYNASRYKKLTTFDLTKTQAMFEVIVRNPHLGVIIIASEEQKDLGMIVGLMSELPFSKDRIATELALWVEDRKSRAFFKLVKAYLYWAKTVQKATLIQLASLADNPTLDQYYTNRLGFTKTEEAYTWRV